MLQINTRIIFCITFDTHVDFSKAEKIVQKAYDEWWELSDAEPIADYIS